MKSKKSDSSLGKKSGFWILLVAALFLETTALIQYFCSRAAIEREVALRAKTELRSAELEINVLTSEMEAAAKMLSTMAETNLDNPEAMYASTRILLQTLDHVESAGIAFIPNYYPKYGRWFEVCSSRSNSAEGGIYTRQIGGAHHDYLQSEWFGNGLTIDSAWWCEPYLDDTGAKTMVVSCSYPIKDKEGKVVAVTCIDLSLNRLSHISQYLQVYKDSYYSIQSSTGMDIVARPDTIPGRRYKLFVEEIDATGWHISIIIPEDILFAELRRLGLLITILMLVGLGLLIFIMVRAGKNLKSLMIVNSQKERIESELEIAQTIQSAMLPKVFPPFLDRLDLNIYGMVKPAKEIGGDLYDFYVRHDKLFFCLGDVSGKGVPAALVMATVRSLFRSVTSHEEDAAVIMQQINDSLGENNEQNMFVTLFLGVLDLKSGQLHYCNAGHNAPILNQTALPVKANLPIGIDMGHVFEAQSAKMQPNDVIFLYTDGLTEAENVRHELFGEQRMMDILTTVFGMRPRLLVSTMQNAEESFVDGAQQSDDLTMLAIRFEKPAIVMRNDIQQIPTLAEWIDGMNIPMELNMPINLALEEAVTNVMLYAYPGRTDGKVFVECVQCNGVKGEQLIFTISDSGVPFDPTQAPEVDTSLSAEERAIGGLGIHLVRQLMDEITYERIDNMNVLTLVKYLANPQND